MKIFEILKHQGPLVLVLAALGLFFATGHLRLGSGDAHDEHDGEEVAADPHTGHDHGAEPAVEPAADPHAGHDHGAEHVEEADPHDDCDHDEHSEEIDPHAGHDHAAVSPTASLERLAKINCEHRVPAVDCDGCRFEIGVVKVDPEVEGALLERGIVGEQEAMVTLRLTGQVELDRNLVVDVPTTAPGRVLKVLVDLGDPVEEGDLLAIIHSGSFGEAKAKWLEALTDCEVARSERERQDSVAAAVTALVESLAAQDEAHGDDGETLLELPAGAVGAWKSKLVRASARLRAARIEHAREKALEEKGISASAEHEQAHEAYEAAIAEYEALIEEVKLTVGVDSLKAENAYRQASARVMVTEQRLRILGMDDEALAKLRAGLPPSEFARLEIRAPRSGVITAFDLSAGRLVEADATLMTIADKSKLWVWCDVYERDLGVVVNAMADQITLDAEVRVASFPTESFPGTIDLIGSEMDVHTRTVKVRLLLDNEDGRLRPGMFADVTVGIPMGGHVRVVPRTALMTDEGDAFVFQHWKDDLWVRRDVRVLAAIGDSVQIEGDLPEGATIAVGGAFMLKSDVLREKMGAG